MPFPSLEQCALGAQCLAPQPGMAFWQRRPESLEGQGAKGSGGRGLPEAADDKEAGRGQITERRVQFVDKLKMVVMMARAPYPRSATSRPRS